MVVCLERVADLHTAQLMPLPLTVSCFSEIQIGSTFLVPAHPGSPRKRAVKRVCVCVCVFVCVAVQYKLQQLVEYSTGLELFQIPDRSVSNVVTSVTLCAVAPVAQQISALDAVAMVQCTVLEANVKVNRAYLRVVYGRYHNAVMLFHVLVHNDYS